MSNKNKVTVIRTKRRVSTVILVLIISAMMSSFILAASLVVSNARDKSEEVSAMLDKYAGYSDSAYELMADSYGIGLRKLVKSTSLTASVLRRTEDEWNTDGDSSGVRLYEDGCLFRYDGTNVLLPEGLPSDMNTKVIIPEDDHGVIADNSSEGVTDGKYAISYFRLKDGWYYMEWIPFDESDETTRDVDWDELFENIADTYEISVIEMVKEADDYRIAGGSERFVSYGTAGKLGLSGETIESSMNGKNQLVNINGEGFLMQSKIRDNSADQEMVVSVLLPINNILRSFSRSFIAFILIMLIFCIALVVWIVLAFRLVSKGPHEELENEKLRPSELKKKVIIYILASTLFMGCCCAFSYAMSNLFTESTHASKALNNISESIEAVNNGNKTVWEENRKEYIDEAQEIAAIMVEHPQLRNSEWLREASGIIGADYIMLFDTNGDEILTDSGYRQLSLGYDENSATYDFRRLLKGVKSISHEKVTDETTGLTRDMYGVSLKYTGREEDAYGALIIAVDPAASTSANLSEKLGNINNLMSAHSVGESLSFAVDPETGKIKYSSADDYAAKNALDLGMTESALRNSFIGFFDFDSVRRFGRSEEKDELLYYYSSKQGRMFSGTANFALICMILYLITIALTAHILMRGYNDTAYNNMLSGESHEAAGGNVKTEKHMVSNTGMLKVFKTLGISGGPFRKAMMTLMMLASIVLIVMLFMALQSGGSSETDSVITYIMKGDWDKGINIFAMTAAFLVMGNAVLVIAVLYAVRIVLGSVLNARGETICALITSVLQYLTAIIGIFISLGYFGIDYRALLASVGILSMAVTFGAKDFVADIFAGINILTNNAYQMGDIVEIAGYKGMVREVNLRTTKIIGSGGNIKTIRNSTIGDVINMSAHNSIYTAEIVVSIENDLPSIEEMLKNELPEIGAKYPQFISGPEYKGVSSMGGGRETLLIQTECSQKDYGFVVSTVNREIQLLFKKNGISIL